SWSVMTAAAVSSQVVSSVRIFKAFTGLEPILVSDSRALSAIGDRRIRRAFCWVPGLCPLLPQVPRPPPASLYRLPPQHGSAARQPFPPAAWDCRDRTDEATILRSRDYPAPLRIPRPATRPIRRSPWRRESDECFFRSGADNWRSLI